MCKLLRIVVPCLSYYWSFVFTSPFHKHYSIFNFQNKLYYLPTECYSTSTFGTIINTPRTRTSLTDLKKQFGADACLRPSLDVPVSTLSRPWRNLFQVSLGQKRILFCLVFRLQTDIFLLDQWTPQLQYQNLHYLVQIYLATFYIGILWRLKNFIYINLYHYDLCKLTI